jgi:flagellar hook-basal body complex protein FliE
MAMSNTIGSFTPQALPSLPQPGTGRNEKSPGFGDALTSAIEQVDKVQSDADLQVTNLVQGKEQDVHSALIAVEKADISFQLMMQVRNKIVNAYQEIARMQF